MSQKRHPVDQIIAKLRRVDVLLGKGTNVPELGKQLEIAEQTYYRWRKKYGGMQPEMAKGLKALQKENARLKKMVAKQALDMAIFKEAWSTSNSATFTLRTSTSVIPSRPAKEARLTLSLP